MSAPKRSGGWQKCAYCDWWTFRAVVCRDHGNRTGGMERRNRRDGTPEWRQGNSGPIGPAMRKGVER